MKKFFSLSAAAALVAIGVSPVFAQATNPLPAVEFNPNANVVNPDGTPRNSTGNNARIVTVQGDIPEFIQFTSIDNVLEFGDMGGPLNTGLPLELTTALPANAGFVASATHGGEGYGNNGSIIRTPYRVHGNSPFNDTSGNLSEVSNGLGGVQFRSNTYIVVQPRANPMRNLGPDGAAGTSDDVVLTTGYGLYFRGTARRYQPTTGTISESTTGLSGGTYNHSSAPATGGANTTFRGYRTSPFGWQNVNSEDTLLDQFIFKPGSPFPAPYDSNGVVFVARVKRNGLNDYRGDYVAKINLTYYKF